MSEIFVTERQNDIIGRQRKKMKGETTNPLNESCLSLQGFKFTGAAWIKSAVNLNRCSKGSNGCRKSFLRNLRETP